MNLEGNSEGWSVWHTVCVCGQCCVYLNYRLNKKERGRKWSNIHKPKNLPYYLRNG